LGKRRKAEAEGRLGAFLAQWKASMELSTHSTPPFLGGFKPTDCTLVLESSAQSLQQSRMLRSAPFDPFTPSQLPYNRVTDGLPSIPEQILSLPPVHSQRARRFLDVWTEEELHGTRSPQHFSRDDRAEEGGEESAGGELGKEEVEDHFLASVEEDMAEDYQMHMDH